MVTIRLKNYEQIFFGFDFRILEQQVNIRSRMTTGVNIYIILRVKHPNLDAYRFKDGFFKEEYPNSGILVTCIGHE